MLLICLLLPRQDHNGASVTTNASSHCSTKVSPATYFGLAPASRSTCIQSKLPDRAALWIGASPRKSYKNTNMLKMSRFGCAAALGWAVILKNCCNEHSAMSCVLPVCWCRLRLEWTTSRSESGRRMRRCVLVFVWSGWLFCSPRIPSAPNTPRIPAACAVRHQVDIKEMTGNTSSMSCKKYVSS